MELSTEVLNEIVKDIKVLIKEEYEAEVLEAERLKKQSITFDWKRVYSSSPSLADNILDYFEDVCSLFRSIISTDFKMHKDFNARFINLSESLKVPIWEIRQKHIGSLITIEGYIRKVSKVYHKIRVKTFECSMCGEKTSLFVKNNKTKPKKCVHCNGENFRTVGKQIYDLQKMSIEEDPNEIGYEQKPQRKLVLLTNDLVSPEISKKLQPSLKVRVNGILKEEELNNKDEYSTTLEANSVEVLHEKLTVTKQDIKEIKEFVKQPNHFEKLSYSLAPTIYGNKPIKESLMLMLVGGTHTYDNNILDERGNIHIILIGNPGSGKTALLRRVIQFIPRSRYIGGATTSGAGLIATANKDEEFNEWVLEPGAMAICHKSMVGIDELDKIDKVDLGYLNIALDKLKVPFDKATIHAELDTDTTVLAAANPVHKVFDEYESIPSQIKLPKDFLDRFDLLFAIKSPLDEESQRKIITSVFGRIRKTESPDVVKPEFISKFIMYVKNLKPKMTKACEKYIEEKFIELVKPGSEKEGAYFSSRLLMNIIRLSTAHAKVRLSTTIGVDDAQVAVGLVIESFKSQRIITEEFGTLDIVALEKITPKSVREQLSFIKEIVKSLDTGKGADFREIVEKATEQGITEEQTEMMINKLKNELYEPRSGKYKLL